VLLDEDNTVGVKGASSRGICYTQKSLEIFDRLGIYSRIAAKGIQWSVGRTFAGQHEVYSFDLRRQGNFSLSTQPPFINIQQFYIEGFLVERIQQLGRTDLRWNNRLSGFEQDGQGATLTVQTPAGSYRLRASHVIDATGSASPLRRWLAVPFQARRGDDRWCIADVRFSRHPPVERHTWIEAPFNDNRAVWQHLMADEVWRIDYQMAPDSDPAAVSGLPQVRERLQRQFGADVQVEIVWVGPYAYRSECVDTMRAGRVFFMGDSAKIVSPFGARGGNTGVSDADNLAWKLAAVLKGFAPPRLLDSYHHERHQAATENVRVTNRTARFLRPSDGIERVFRSATIALARRHPFARQLINTGRMAVANRYTQSEICSPEAGFSVQNVAITWADGSPGALNDLLRWADGRLLLLVFGPIPEVATTRLCQLVASAPLRVVQVLRGKRAGSAREHVLDGNGRLAAACAVALDEGWALLRPDAYLSASGSRVDGRLVLAVQRALAMACRNGA
jgi:3-(3-hydroxy-phenyl)propionate hydroxylase